MTILIDQVLAFIQKRCRHPELMVAVDVLEGSAEPISVAWCRRCGAVQVIHDYSLIQENRWRRPDPNLWRG
jgi:hypothetical protein